MRDKTKNLILVISFFVIILGGLIINLITEDKTISISERRKLKQFPILTISKILDGTVGTELEEYVIDQFVGRDLFKQIKTFCHFYILGQKDNNGLFISEGGIYKQTGELKEKEIEKAANKFKLIQDKFLSKENKVYYAIIPDKNYYLSEEQLKMDYTLLQEIMKSKLKDMQYINLFSVLEKEDYYRTDIHWKQENLTKVAKVVGSAMNTKVLLEKVDRKTKGEFYGAYYSQLGLKIEPDTLSYLINPSIENSVTYNYETQKSGKVYDEERWKRSSDKYDFFVSGATPLITITNPLAKEEKELIIFRDSFGSSLAPLLLEGYSKITLVDIRYISSMYLDQYIEFKNQDILFLYSTLVLNEASILR